MWLFLVGILFHKSHKKNEQNGGSSDPNDNRYHHNDLTQSGDEYDITLAYRHLRHNLVVDTSHKIVQIRIDALK